MNGTTRTASLTAHPTEGRRALSHQLAGLTVASLFPALFWMAFAALAARAFGYHLASLPVMLLGASISLFLASVCAPIMLRR